MANIKVEFNGMPDGYGYYYGTATDSAGKAYNINWEVATARVYVDGDEVGRADNLYNAGKVIERRIGRSLLKSRFWWIPWFGQKVYP